MPSRRALPSLSVVHVALLLPWITAVIAARLPIRDNSFLWHVTAGRLQIDSGRVLTSDPFSFTFAGEPWRTQSWLLELGYGMFDRMGGLAFVAPFMVATTVATFGLILLVTFRATKSVLGTAVIGTLTAWLAAAFLSPRPVLASYLCLAIVVAVATDKRLRWVLPLVTWVWAGVHASFLLGIGYVVLAGLRDRDRRAAVDAAAMTLVSGLTAHGWGVWQLLLEFAGNQDALDTIQEWATPDFTHVALVPFLVGIVLMIVAGMRGSLRPADLWVLTPFLAFAMTATRAVFPPWIALAPLAGAAMTRVVRPRRSSAREQRLLAGMTVILVAFPLILPVADDVDRLSPMFPIQAAGHLTGDRLFHDDFTGGYLIYRFGTDRRVFVDDRAELYGAAHMQAMADARRGFGGWEDLFADWHVDQALVGSGDGLASLLREAGWVVDYEDDDYVVFSR